jgi:hypothetical protein
MPGRPKKEKLEGLAKGRPTKKRARTLAVLVAIPGIFFGILQETAKTKESTAFPSD